MFFPFNVDVPMERIPIVNWVLVGVTVMISMMILNAEPEGLIKLLFLFRGADFSITQLPGHTLVHADMMHLLGNMIFLFCFGNAINAKFGHVTFVVFYFAMGIITAMAWLLFGTGDAAVGASGAIMGVVGAFLILYPKNEVSVFYFFVVRFGTFQMPSGALIAIYLAFDLWGLVSTEAAAIAYVAHVVGALMGALVAIVFLKTGLIESTRYEQNLLQILNLQR